MSGKTRIVLADEDPIVLNGLRNLITTEGDLDLIGEATNGAVALAIIRERQPDVAIVDIFMPGLNGIVLIRRLASELPSISVLVLTLHEDRGFVRQAFDAGAMRLRDRQASIWFRRSERLPAAVSCRSGIASRVLTWPEACRPFREYPRRIDRARS
jgi:CheY-like chemotaxis protein